MTLASLYSSVSTGCSKGSAECSRSFRDHLKCRCVHLGERSSVPHRGLIRTSAASVTPETWPMRRSLSRLIIQRISRTLRVLVIEFQTAREGFGDFGKSSGSLRFNSFGSQSSESPVSPLCPHTSAGYCVCWSSR